MEASCCESTGQSYTAAPITQWTSKSNIPESRFCGACIGRSHYSCDVLHGTSLDIGDNCHAMTTSLNNSTTPNDPDLVVDPAARWPATDELIKNLASRWLDQAGIHSFGTELANIESLDRRPHRLKAISTLCNAVLSTDAAAIAAVSDAIGNHNGETRASIINLLGQNSVQAWRQVEPQVVGAVTKACEEQHLACSLVLATQRELSKRQTNHDFASWTSRDPEGFATHAWSAALRVVCERLWDRNWAKVSRLGALPPRLDAGVVNPRHYQSVTLRLRAATNAARLGAIESLVHSAMQPDSHPRASVWDAAVAAANAAPGAQAWSADVAATRAGVGEAAWAAANQSARSTTQVVVNELPHVTGRIVVVALAAELCGSAARAVAIEAGVRALAGHDEVHEVAQAARASMAVAVIDLCA